MTVILGLTGSIGTGKSTTAAFFARRGVPVYDADRAVHDLYRAEGVAAVATAFPDVVVDGAVDRTRLGAAVFGDREAMARLEAIVHPLVRAREARFRAAVRRSAAPVAVVDVPLLFETGRERTVDAVVLTVVDPETQRRRVLARPGMTGERYERILAQQMPTVDKRRRAHFIVDTGHGLEAARRQVAGVLKAVALMVR